MVTNRTDVVTNSRDGPSVSPIKYFIFAEKIQTNMKNHPIALYIDLLFCLVIMPLAIRLLPVDRWIATNTAFLLTLVAYV